jgi:DNA-binding NarL/FixJ family response regulator
MRIGIAEDSGIFLEGLRMQLDRLGQQVVIAVRTADELLALAARRPIDAAILDVRLPPALSDEGLRLADQLAASHPKVGILVLSQYAEPAYASRLFEHGTARRGYLVKDRVANAEVLKDALRRVCDGESVIDEKLIGDLLAHQRHLSKLDSLTEREQSILGYMAGGRSNQGNRGDDQPEREGRRGEHRAHLRQARPRRQPGRQPARARRPRLAARRAGPPVTRGNPRAGARAQPRHPPA